MADNASSYLQAARQTQDLRKQKPLSSRQINSMTANDSNTYNIYDTSNHKNTKKTVKKSEEPESFLDTQVLARQTDKQGQVKTDKQGQVILLET